LNKPE